jgi:hypothetical protein
MQSIMHRAHPSHQNLTFSAAQLLPFVQPSAGMVTQNQQQGAIAKHLFQAWQASHRYLEHFGRKFFVRLNL